MPEQDHHYDDRDLFNRETHHESSDVPIRPLWWAIIIFIVFAIVTHIVLLFFYKGLVVAERNRMAPPETAIARPADADVPQNQPLLQPFPRVDGEGRAIPPQAATPVVDMITMRAEEEKALRNYGWVNREQGIVRIPIDQAKALTAARLAIQGQLTGGAPAAVTTTEPILPGGTISAAGTVVPPDTGIIPPPTSPVPAQTTTSPGTTNPLTGTDTSGGSQ